MSDNKSKTHGEDEGEFLETHAQDTHATNKHADWDWSDSFPEDWVRGGILPELEEKHPDMGYRWIRVSVHGEDDRANMNRQFQNWRPVPVSEVPERIRSMKSSHGQFGEVIQVEGLVLCWCPRKLLEKRAAAVRDRTLKQQRTMEQATLGSVADRRSDIYGRPEVVEDSTREATPRSVRNDVKIAAD